MPNEAHEQEQDNFEYESLLGDNTPASEPERKGYEYYAAKAAQEAEGTASTAEVTNASPAEPADKVQETTIPEKFKGKSPEEIIEMYTNLESEFGRRANQIGELRRVNDQLLELSDPSEKKTTPDRKPVQVDTLLENPDQVITEAVDNNPRLKAIEEKLTKADILEAKTRFETAHPQWQQQLQSDQSFQQWIMESPLRQKLILEADKNYDYDTAKEVYDLYDQVKGNKVQEATDERNSNARQAVDKQVTESKSLGESQPKKKFKRSEIIHLRIHNPALYEQRKAEIMDAYNNDRVLNDL